MFFLLLDILLYGCLIKPYCAYIISSTAKVSVPKFILQICVFINIISELFSFEVSINCDTLSLGGILTSI